MRRGLDADAGDDSARIGVRFGVPAHHGADQCIAAVPADHLDAAVGTGVDVQQPRRADGFFADFTEGRTRPVPPPGVTAITGGVSGARLGACHGKIRRDHKSREGGKPTGAQHRNLQLL